MRCLAITLLLMLPSAAFAAEPVVIDLSAERAAYAKQASNRNWGLGLLIATGTAGAVSYFGYSSALSAQTDLKAQQVPIDLQARRTLIDQGSTGNTLGVAGLVAGIAFAVGSAYFLTVSF